MGLSVKHAKEILEIGADCIRRSRFDQKDMPQFIETEHRILRPKFSKSAPVRAQTYMKRQEKYWFTNNSFYEAPFDDPFSEIDGILSKILLGWGASIPSRYPL